MKHVRISKDEYINPDLFATIKGGTTMAGVAQVTLEGPDLSVTLTDRKARRFLERMAMTADALEELRDTIQSLNAEVAELSRQMAGLDLCVGDFGDDEKERR